MTWLSNSNPEKNYRIQQPIRSSNPFGSAAKIACNDRVCRKEWKNCFQGSLAVRATIQGHKRQFIQQALG
jgi:hypothetical protein